MPTSYPLYKATGPVKDAALTVPCSSPHPAGLACGDFAVNTIQPFYQPYAPGTAEARRLPPQEHPTIGDRLSAKGIDWAWYSGGWSNANGDVGGPGWTNGSTPGTCTDPQTATGAVWPNCPNKLFQYHHQSFNYFKAYAPGTAGAPAAPARRGGVRGARRRLATALPAQAGQPDQADRCRERASRLRQRAQRLRPPRRPADRGPAVALRQGHDGHRHLRRVRRPMGPRPAAGPGHDHARTARRDGTQHPDPRADHRAGPAPIRSASTAPRTTPPRSWPRSSTATACGPSRPATPPSRTSRPCSAAEVTAATTETAKPGTRTAAPRGRPSHLLSCRGGAAA